MSNTLWPRGLQHTRLPCPPLSPRVCSNSCPLSQWCYLTISSSAALFFCLQSFPTSVCSNNLALHIRWSKNWSLSISPSNEYSRLIFFRMDWFDLLAVQGALKSLLQHRKLKASILRYPAFFMIQISHPYMTTGKTTLSIRTYVMKVMSLLFNMLSRFVIPFLPRSKHHLISMRSNCFHNNTETSMDFFHCADMYPDVTKTEVVKLCHRKNHESHARPY